MDNRQHQSAGTDAGEALTWFRYGPDCGRSYELQKGSEYAGMAVKHCGHPTANWPYYIEAAWHHRMILAPNGHGFRLLAEAKQAAVEIYHRHQRGEEQCTFTF
jgi:hypothetical protein